MEITDFIPTPFKHYLYSLFILVEYAFFIFFIWLNILNELGKKLILIFSILFTLFIIIYTATAKINVVDPLSTGIETIIILSFAFYFLYEDVNKLKDSFIYNDYRFWIILGMIIYLSGSFFIFILADQLTHKERWQFWLLTWIFYILKSIFFVIGIIIHAYQPKRKITNSTMPYLDVN